MGLFRKAEPRVGGHLTEKELRKFQSEGARFNWLKFQSIDCVHFFDDFLGDTVDSNLYVLDAGATATAFAHSAAAGGIIRGAVGTTAATSGLQLESPAIWLGDNYCGFETRIRTSVVTEIRIEVGLFNALPAVNTAVGNNLSTPTFNTSANLLMFLFDNASATDTVGWYTDGTGGTAAAAKTAITGHALVADTWKKIRIQAFGTSNTAALWLDDKLVIAPGTVYWEGGTSNIFGISVKKSDTTDANIDVDYIRIWQERP